MLKKIVILFFSCFAVIGLSNAQRSYSAHEPENLYREGVDLFCQEKYATAYDVMKVVAENSPDDHIMLMNASYYRAASSARLIQNDAIALLNNFIGDFPESPYVYNVYFELANIYYQKKQYADFLDTYKQINPGRLSQEQQTELLFKKGYAYFMRNKYDDAKLCFLQVFDQNSQYAVVAQYYYAFILYTEENYKTSLDIFEKLRDDKTFGSIVPYYILQVYYKLGYNDSVINIGVQLIDKASSKRAVEMSRLIGEAYYRKGDYENALPYLQKYFAKINKYPNREENYLLGYIYFQLEKYDTAANYFNELLRAGKNDLLAQNTLYHAGFCELKLDKKHNALNSFKDAALLDIDGRITEDATYNYLKLSYELSFAPYNEPMKIVQKYLEDNPNTLHKNEMLGYLVNMYMSSKNYLSAYNSLKEIKRKNVQLLEAQQRMAYNVGIEYFNKDNFAEAKKHFGEAVEWDYDENITLSAKYWGAEASYRNGDFEQATSDYQKFLSSSLAKSRKEYLNANYGLGYSYFSLKHYKEAVRYFKVVADADMTNKLLKNDAALRLADAYYMQKNIGEAIKYYDMAIALEQHNKDYALMQEALCLGVLGKFDEKIRILDQVLTMEKSSILPKAYSELGATYLIKENNAKALEYYKMVSEKYPQTSYGKIAMLKQGLIYFNTGNSNKALAAFEAVIAKYPNTIEAKEALVSIRNIYIADNRVDEFFAYTKKIGTEIKSGEQDSITYEAAERLYASGDYNTARNAFISYIDKFPDGIFLTEAAYYAADCSMQVGNGANALKYFDIVIAQPESFFTETSMISAAKIAFDQKNYNDAVKRYQNLVNYSEKPKNIEMAKIAIFRCQVELGDPKSIIATAKELLKINYLTPQLKEDAVFRISRSERQLGNDKEANKWIYQLSNAQNSNYSAEAQYYKIEEIFNTKEYVECDKMINDYVSKGVSNDYFLAKAFLLWGQIYFFQENYLQASRTFQSIIDNYDGEDDVKLKALELLQEVMNKEAQIMLEQEKQNRQADSQDEELYMPEEI
jgi:tetratricopeptide (TPR) repeat protein